MTQAVMEKPRKIFLIATEPSGDHLGAALIKELRGRLGSNAQFAGIGGAEMAREGLASLFPIGDLAIVGFAGVAKQLPMLLRRIREAAAAVVQAKPDILVIIDSPDFTHRVARRVRKVAPSIPIVDYASPTVWVWRPGRARAMTHYVEHVLAVLPFEPDVHRKLDGPPCTYIGHPLTERLDTLRPNAQEQERRNTPPPVLVLLPGAQWLSRWLPEWTVQELDFGNGVPAGDNARLHPLPLPLEESGAPQERVPPAASPESKPE